MKNTEVAKILYLIGDILEIKEVPFKPVAYRRAAQIIENYSKNIEEIYNEKGIKGLEEIPAIGKGIGEKIEEYLKTGKLNYLEELKKEIPINIEELMSIEGLGPKRIKLLYQKLKIKNLKDLENAVKEGKIKEIIGVKVEENIKESLKNIKKEKRFLLGFIWNDIKLLEEELKNFKKIKRIEICGSTRRGKETLGDLDILTISEYPEDVIEYFTKLKEVDRILAKGKTRSTVLLKNGLQVDLRVMEENTFGAAMQYFTGNKEHNIELRKIAISKGYKLSEYGLFKDNKVIVSKDEKEIYNKLGLDFIEPELRENTGEIEAAKQRRLPKLIRLSDVRGDCHMHTNETDGTSTMEEMIEQAMKIGREYIVFTDHTKSLGITRGMDEKRILKQIKLIEKMNKKYGDKIKILKGVELNIMDDGKLDIKDSVLKQLDVVVGSIHTGFKQTEEKITKRTITAMENENIDIIGHPTGRLIQVRESFAINMQKIFDKAKETKTILEINSYPSRLDIKDIYIKEAIRRKLKLVINTDSHHVNHMEYMKFGVIQARRGWAEAKDIINTYPYEKFKKFLK